MVSCFCPLLWMGRWSLIICAFHSEIYRQLSLQLSLSVSSSSSSSSLSLLCLLFIWRCAVFRGGPGSGAAQHRDPAGVRQTGRPATQHTLPVPAQGRLWDHLQPFPVLIGLDERETPFTASATSACLISCSLFIFLRFLRQEMQRSSPIQKY